MLKEAQFITWNISPNEKCLKTTVFILNKLLIELAKGSKWRHLWNDSEYPTNIKL